MLIDFGKSRRKENPKKYKLTSHEKDVYSKTYKHLAPELLEGLPQSEQSDIYSVGVVFAFIQEHIQGIKELPERCTKALPGARECLNALKDKLLLLNYD